MNELTVFTSEEFGSVRTLTINDEPWFVAKDISDKLGYAQTSNMMKRIDEDDFKSSILDGMNMKSLLINESGLYAAILGSKLESAKRFKKWVTSEVLPSIRKNGGYIAGQETLSDDELIARALMVAQKKIEERDRIIEQKQARIEEMRPKEIFADAVTASNTSILIGELAKLIKQNGVDIGQNRLFAWMRKNGYLTRNNEPTQKSMDLKLFQVMERTLNNPDGSIRITRTTKCTGKGQTYFVNKFLNKEQ